jgi:hypothetical protein
MAKEIFELKFTEKQLPLDPGLQHDRTLKNATHCLHVRIEPHKRIERPSLTVYCTGPILKALLWTPEDQVNPMIGAKGDMYTFTFSEPPLEPGKPVAITIYSTAEIRVTGLTAQSRE